MRNRRGQIFVFYLLILTLFMCGVVVMMYFAQQDNAESSLISPRVVLDLRDDMERFEWAEEDLIGEILIGTEGDFGSDSFVKSFRSKFLFELDSNEWMKDFLLEGIYLDGIDIESDARRQSLEFFTNTLYPEAGTYFEEGKIVFRRARVDKKLFLVAADKTKINFNTELNFNFEREYLISFENDKFNVEVL